MPHVKSLLNKLNSMEPISNEFGDNMRKLVSKQTKNNNYIFLKPGQFASKAWTLLSGFIVSIGQDINGTPVVINIYSKGAIVTDLLSFFKKDPVAYKFVAIGKVEVLELKKEDYFELEQYPETSKLLLFITFLELKMSNAKSELLLLPPKAKMIRFFKDYDVSGLPDKYCASFLRITLEKYIELKIRLVKSHEIKNPPGSAKSDTDSHNRLMVYEVKKYVIENFTRHDMGDIVQIAGLFNTTKKTLTRYFLQVLGITVHDLILKLRMQMALDLLSNHKKPVKEVYSQVGYKDIYHFSKTFKSYFGFSAKEAITRGVS